MPIWRTIGIDPGLTNTGLCSIVGDPAVNTKTCDYRLVVPGRHFRAQARLDYIETQVRDFLSDHPSALVVIEGYDYKGFSLVQMAEINGILQLAAYRAGGVVMHASPSQVKKFAAGHPQAEKEAVMRAYALDNEHLADARALAEIGQVFLSGKSTKRCELEVVYQLRHGATEKAAKKKSSTKSKAKLVAL